MVTPSAATLTMPDASAKTAGSVTEVALAEMAHVSTAVPGGGTTAIWTSLKLPTPGGTVTEIGVALS